MLCIIIIIILLYILYNRNIETFVYDTDDIKFYPVNDGNSDSEETYYVCFNVNGVNQPPKLTQGATATFSQNFYEDSYTEESPWTFDVGYNTNPTSWDDDYPEMGINEAPENYT